MADFQTLIEKTLNGQHPVQAIDEALSGDGSDRKDDFNSEDQKVAAFTKIASTAAASLPYVGPDWINTIADQLRNANSDGVSELIAMAQRNREQYAGSLNIDAGGSFQLWDGILRGLLATQTDQIPPGPAPMTSRPQLV